MKPIIITALLTLFKSMALAQPKAELSATAYLRMDKYPAFFYATGPTTGSTVNIKGLSPGFNIDYTRKISNTAYVNGRIGYYRYSFNKIERSTDIGTAVNSRPTNLQLLPGAFITFDTDKYFYNTVCFGIGTGKNFQLPRNILFRAGCMFNNYVTFSQKYQITYDNPDNQIENPYRSTQARYFAFEGDVQLSVLKFTGRYRFGPIILLPVYSVWKADDVFTYEKNSGSRSKWFKGFGAGFTFCYPLTAKNN